MLAADFERMWMVLEDLGDEQSLADALLGSIPTLAMSLSRPGQPHWANSTATVPTQQSWLAGPHKCGARTACRPRISCVVLASARARLEKIRRIPLEAEAAAIEVDRRLSDQRWWAMTPRDPCPDNCALLPNGSVVLFDFEGGGIRHSLLDAAYLVTTFPTCWCTGNLPPAVRSAGLAAYRDAADWGFEDFDEHLSAAAAFHGLWVLSSFRMTDALGERGDSGWHWSEVDSTYLLPDRSSPWRSMISSGRLVTTNLWASESSPEHFVTA